MGSTVISAIMDLQKQSKKACNKQLIKLRCSVSMENLKPNGLAEW